jgi:hypothetical protein
MSGVGRAGDAEGEPPQQGVVSVDVPPPDDSPDPLKAHSSASPTSATPTTGAVVSSRLRAGGEPCNMAERFSFALRATRGSGLRVAFTKSERARCQSRGTPLPSA